MRASWVPPSFALVAAAAIFLGAGPAAADATPPFRPPPPPPYTEASIWLPVGGLVSVSNRAAGIGVELALDFVGDMLTEQNRRPYKQSLGVGLLGQAQRLSDGANRLVGGGQVFWEGMLGVELAAAWRLKSGADEMAFHVAPFLSVGFVTVSVVVDLPVSHDGPGEPPTEVGVAIAVKYPFPLNGEWPSFKIGG